MTVCIGAIADGTTIIGVSDKMLTAGHGEIEFETGQIKAWQFSNAIIGLVAGDITVLAQILRELDRDVKSWIDADPKTWVSVKDVATVYCQKVRDFRRSRAEAEILHPLGLDLSIFLTHQAKMQVDIALELKNKLVEYELPLIETIFMGIDTDGPQGRPAGDKVFYPQLYSTWYDKPSCLTTIGFAAIGIGKSHAESQFMFSGHWPNKPLHETVLLAYGAKKRAEAAPGVGKETDLIVVGPTAGYVQQALDKYKVELERIYQKSRRATLRGLERAQKETQELIERVKQGQSKPSDSRKSE